MIGRLGLLAALAVALVAATEKPKDLYREKYVADKEFLLKQKFVFDVLDHYNQPKLNKELYEVGLKYNLRDNIQSYTNQEAVEDFLRHAEYGLLHHDAIYSVYDNAYETKMVYKLMYYAQDYETFYNTVLYLRNRINHDLFVYAFYLAVIHRPDTKYVRLPPLYEIMPYMFYNSELLEQAHHVEYFGQTENNNSGYRTYVIPYNYSGHYLKDEYDYNYENLLTYFTEDVSLNEYYFYFRNQYPYLLSSNEIGESVNYRGEEYMFGHKNLIARLHLERVTNGLEKIEHFDYHGKFYPGYYPTMTYPNSLPFPVRPSESNFPKTKDHDIQLTMNYEARIMDAVDSGYVLRKDGKMVKIYTPEGLNILGNLIEGNADSYNTQYYGQVDGLVRRILGWSVNPGIPYRAQPSALQHFVTSLRDPAFARLYFKLKHYYSQYKDNLGHYKREEIVYPDLKIESVKVDQLVTYFDTFDSTISHGLAAPTKEIADSVLIKARQQRLNHKPFSVNITINSEYATNASVKVFLAPKYTVRGYDLKFEFYHDDYYYQLDNYVVDLESGTNVVVRDATIFTSSDNESYESYYKRVVDALESESSNFMYEKRIYGFPNRLLLPKGKPEGLPMVLFVHVAPVIGEPLHYTSSIFGETDVDNRAFGYPLDRPVIAHDFVGPNMKFTDVKIYHQGQH